MYKTNKGWVTAGISTVAMASMFLIGSSDMTSASADEVAPSTGTTTTGNNAVGATTATPARQTTNIQQVTPNASSLDAAVNAAKATENVAVAQKPTQAIQGKTVAEATQKAEADYAQQSQVINDKVAKQQVMNDRIRNANNTVSNFNNANDAKSELEGAVKAAQNAG